jgi:hypothetical protein
MFQTSMNPFDSSDQVDERPAAKSTAAGRSAEMGVTLVGIEGPALEQMTKTGAWPYHMVITPDAWTWFNRVRR